MFDTEELAILQELIFEKIENLVVSYGEIEPPPDPSKYIQDFQILNNINKKLLASLGVTNG